MSDCKHNFLGTQWDAPECEHCGISLSEYKDKRIKELEEERNDLAAEVVRYEAQVERVRGDQINIKGATPGEETCNGVWLGEGKTIVSDVCAEDGSWSGVMVSRIATTIGVGEAYEGEMRPLFIMASKNPQSFTVIRHHSRIAKAALTPPK